MRGHWDEGRDWLRRALAVPVATFPGDASDLSAWRLRALQGAGSLALYQDDYAFAEHCFAEGLDLARSLGDETQVAVLQGSLGRVTYARGEYAPARRHFEESLRLHRAHGNLPGIAASTGNLALVLEDMNDLAGARALHEESLRLDEALGNTRGVAISLSNLGTVARFQNDYPAARTFYEHAEALYRALGGYRGGEASVLCHRGMVALGENDRERACRLCREGLTRSQELGDRRTVLRALEAFAALAVAEEQNGEAGARRAARLLGAAEALRAEIRASPSAPEQAELDHWLAPARTVLGAAAWDHAREVGRALGWRAAVAEVLETDEA
jgi:tetratricopeptide (TPR) repeat protein